MIGRMLRRLHHSIFLPDDDGRILALRHDARAAFGVDATAVRITRDDRCAWVVAATLEDEVARVHVRGGEGASAAVAAALQSLAETRSARGEVPA